MSRWRGVRGRGLGKGLAGRGGVGRAQELTSSCRRTRSLILQSSSGVVSMSSPSDCRVPPGVKDMVNTFFFFLEAAS